MSLDVFVSIITRYKFTILFYSLILLLVYLNRKKFDVHGKIIFLYRTKVGIKFMKYVASKAGRLIRFLGYVGIYFGFVGMVFIIGFILYLTYNLLLNVPGSTGASPVIPGLPIAGTGLVFPLITGWIAIFIIVVVHEFSHGIVAKAHNIEIKHSGIAFFGPILGAFVEPNEKKLSKAKDSVQNSVFAAGPFSNIILSGVVLLMILLIGTPLVSSMVISNGVIISPQPGLPAEFAGVTNETVITHIDGEKISSRKDFQNIMKEVDAGDTVTLSSIDDTFVIETIENPEKPSQAYLGIWVIGPDNELKNENKLTSTIFSIIVWIFTLFYWVMFLSLNIGLINLLPIFITDGARMLKVFFDRVIPNKQKSTSAWLFFNWLSLFSLLILVFLPFFRWFGNILTNILI